MLRVRAIKDYVYSIKLKHFKKIFKESFILEVKNYLKNINYNVINKYRY